MMSQLAEVAKGHIYVRAAVYLSGGSSSEVVT